MAYNSRIASNLYQLGVEATVKVISDGATDDFGNAGSNYTADRKVIAHRTYPNRNTEVESTSGDWHRDQPVFLCPIGPDVNSPPGEEDRLEYQGKVYEVMALTEYRNHVEFFGKLVQQ